MAVGKLSHRKNLKFVPESYRPQLLEHYMQELVFIKIRIVPQYEFPQFLHMCSLLCKTRKNVWKSQHFQSSLALGKRSHRQNLKYVPES